MNANVNYMGLLNLPRNLREAGTVSRTEAWKTAVRRKAETGADIMFPL